MGAKRPLHDTSNAANVSLGFRAAILTIESSLAMFAAIHSHQDSFLSISWLFCHFLLALLLPRPAAHFQLQRIVTMFVSSCTDHTREYTNLVSIGTSNPNVHTHTLPCNTNHAPYQSSYKTRGGVGGFLHTSQHRSIFLARDVSYPFSLCKF